MPPKLFSDDGRNTVIRPLAYCREKDIAAYSELREFPIIPCNLCGSQENLQRQMVKDLLNDWDHRFPGRIENMFRSIQNVAPSHLADPRLFDFGGEVPESQPETVSPDPGYGRVDLVNL